MLPDFSAGCSDLLPRMGQQRPESPVFVEDSPVCSYLPLPFFDRPRASPTILLLLITQTGSLFRRSSSDLTPIVWIPPLSPLRSHDGKHLTDTMYSSRR